MRRTPCDEQYRDDMIFVVLSAKDALGRVPRLNPDLLDVRKSYIEKGDSFFLALDADDRVVGCVGFSRVGDTDAAFLHRLFVKPGLKRRGIGSALLRTAEDAMRAAGIRVSRVHLGAPREQWFESYAFYPKHGYVDDGERHMRKEL